MSLNLFGFLKSAAKPVADGIIATVEAQKPQILAQLASDNVKAADIVEARLLAALEADPHFAPVAKVIDLKPIVDQAMPALVAELGNEEGVAFEFLVGKLRDAEARALA